MKEPLPKTLHREIIGPADLWPRKYARPSRRHERLLGIYFIGGGLLFWGMVIYDLCAGHPLVGGGLSTCRLLQLPSLRPGGGLAL